MDFMKGYCSLKAWIEDSIVNNANLIIVVCLSHSFEFFSCFIFANIQFAFKENIVRFTFEINYYFQSFYAFKILIN
jgi:hypothetical protein